MRELNFTPEDIPAVKSSLSLIFSIYCPGYIEERMTNNIGLETTPLIYFYRVLNDVYNIKFADDEVHTNTNFNTSNVISCITDCLDEPSMKWGDIILSYNLMGFMNKYYNKMRDVLIETLKNVLLENDDGEIILSWKRLYRAIFHRCTTIKHVSFSRFQPEMLPAARNSLG